MNTILVSRADIVALLRSKGKSARADWFARSLPEVVDLGRNSSLLATLDIDPADLTVIDQLLDAPDRGPVTVST